MCISSRSAEHQTVYSVYSVYIYHTIYIYITHADNARFEYISIIIYTVVERALAEVRARAVVHRSSPRQVGLFAAVVILVVSRSFALLALSSAPSPCVVVAGQHEQQERKRARARLGATGPRRGRQGSSPTRASPSGEQR